MSIELRHGPQHDAVNCLCRACRRHVAHTDRCPRAGGALDRRAWLARASGGILGAALATLLQDDRRAQAAAADLRPRAPHFQPRAHAVIQLFMNGGPSQMDLFDPKPELDRRHGEAYFDKIAGEVENASAAGAIMRSPFRFAQHGESGAWVSELLPHTARVVDGRLVLELRAAMRRELTPVYSDAFTAPGLGTVWFTRDPSGRVTAMHFGAARVWDIAFARQP